MCLRHYAHLGGSLYEPRLPQRNCYVSELGVVREYSTVAVADAYVRLGRAMRKPGRAKFGRDDVGSERQFM